MKRRRVELLSLRNIEAQERKEWSRKHGGDEYDETGCGEAKIKKPMEKKPKRKRELTSMGKKSVKKSMKHGILVMIFIV